MAVLNYTVCSHPSRSWLEFCCLICIAEQLMLRFPSTTGQAGLQVAKSFFLYSQNSKGNIPCHQVKSLQVYNMNIKKPPWATLRRAKMQNPHLSLMLQMDEFCNGPRTLQMQNSSPLGLTDVTPGVHNACSYTHKLPAGSGKGCGVVINLFPFSRLLVQRWAEFGTGFLLRFLKCWLV